MSEFDPSIPKPGEDQLTIAEVENQVSLAYSLAMTELEIILELVRLVRKPPMNDKQGLKNYYDLVVKDVRRLELKTLQAKHYLKARDAQFHYRAKRLRTDGRVDRLRLWNREKLRELEACRLQSGEPGYEAARRRFEEEKRVMIKCYELEELWELAMQAEDQIGIVEDDLSSACDSCSEVEDA